VGSGSGGGRVDGALTTVNAVEGSSPTADLRRKKTAEKTKEKKNVKSDHRHLRKVGCPKH
jgi:hypothetical protein